MQPSELHKYSQCPYNRSISLCQRPLAHVKITYGRSELMSQLKLTRKDQYPAITLRPLLNCLGLHM